MTTRLEKRLLIQKARLSCEALALYEPLPHLESVHACNAPERLILGSNRSSKTFTACAEVARAVTGQDPYNKYRKQDGRCFIVGLDGRHNGTVLYRKLFRSGAFKIIPDQQTGLLRNYRPWLKYDRDRRNEVLDAPPLIPRRLVKDETWESKKEMQPRLIRLHNGWEIEFFSSLGKPPQGSDFDLCYFDEEIVDEEWYPEMARGLVDRGGKFIWSATAQKGGIVFYELSKLAAKERIENPDNPRIVEFRAHIKDNPYLSEEDKALFISKLTEEQRAVRIDAEFDLTFKLVYREWDWHTHGIKPFVIPDDWCRYMVVDPGRQVTAVLFAAIPEPEHEMAGHVVLYDELYIRHCNTEIFAKAVREKTQGQNFQDFIIDYRGARVTTLDTGLSIEAQLSEALRRHGVRCNASKFGFSAVYSQPGDIDAGIEKVRSWMVTNAKDGRPILLAFDNLANFAWEIDKYHYSRVRNVTTDKPEARHNHLMDDLRYLAMYNPKWRKPKRGDGSWAWKALRDKQKRHRLKHGTPGVRLGPQGKSGVAV